MNVQETRLLKINCLATMTVLAIQPGVNNSKALTMPGLRVTFTRAERAAGGCAESFSLFAPDGDARDESLRCVESVMSSVRHAQVGSDGDHNDRVVGGGKSQSC
jgi:hypothetical protein